MKHGIKRALALLIALLLALPTAGFAESTDIDPPVGESSPIVIGGDGSALTGGTESNGLTIEYLEEVP